MTRSSNGEPDIDPRSFRVNVRSSANVCSSNNVNAPTLNAVLKSSINNGFDVRVVFHPNSCDTFDVA
jgi:hypothetical protein